MFLILGERKETRKKMKAKPLYEIGDRVYAAQSNYAKERTKCPYCDGTGYWTLKTALEEIQVACGVCGGPWDEVRGYLTNSKWKGEVINLTIGQIRVEEGNEKCKIQYMCEETGIGSGSLWYENKLFRDYNEARMAADEEAKETEENIIEQNEKKAKHETKNAARRAKYKLEKMRKLGIK